MVIEVHPRVRWVDKKEMAVVVEGKVEVLDEEMVVGEEKVVLVVVMETVVEVEGWKAGVEELVADQEE